MKLKWVRVYTSTIYDNGIFRPSWITRHPEKYNRYLICYETGDILSLWEEDVRAVLYPRETLELG